MAVTLGLVLPTLNPQAAGRSPWHDHIVLGAHGLKEWAHALMRHHHVAADLLEPASQEPPLATRRAVTGGRAIRVLSIGQSQDGGGASAFGLYSQALAYRDGTATLPAPEQSGWSLVFASHRPRSVPLSVPEPPPRRSS